MSSISGYIRELMSSWVNASWRWEAGERVGGLRLPTFTQAIMRRRPGPDPVGPSLCDGPTIERWRSGAMRFPPYTRQERFLMSKVGAQGDLVQRVANAREREILKGFRPARRAPLVRNGSWPKTFSLSPKQQL